MNHQLAKELMQRYFAGETSLAEEKELRTYFQSENVDPTLQPYIPLFRYWEVERAVVAPRRPTKTRRLPRILLAIAAALLLVLVARFAQLSTAPAVTAFPVAERQPVDWSRYEVTDEGEALRILKAVLKTTSEKMKQGPAITLRELREVEEILD
ncbi:hypothetical protein GGR28_002280 [Lewinella aquimaris]|uniref:Uncharacterized protein n=1 Tax=Neolewinella aquimaris TaxID=1835722 RepID=A0A840E7Q7_9BACT|nr:hypothetical protein [Neolewinella aquimaris]MBB4079655.1 hypothetical protein [Neolewinella aquimaris]